MLESQGYGLSEDRRFCKSVLGLRSIVDFICNEFIHGGHLLALGASAVALSIMILLDTVIRWEFLIISYLCTLAIYGYDHYRDVERDITGNIDRVNHIRRYYKVYPLILSSYIILFFSLLFYFGNLNSLIFGVLLLLIGLFYTIKVKKLTTKITGFKSIYTSLSVASFVIFTGLYCYHSINLLLILLFVFMFLRFLVNTSFCDIKDIESDRRYNILTLPVVLGKERFMFILHIINIISLIPLIAGIYLNILPLFAMPLVFSIIYGGYYIEKARRVNNVNIESLSSIVADGEFVFWPFILFLGMIFI